MLASLSAYSCGGSHGFGACWLHRTVFPFNPEAFRTSETIAADIEISASQLQGQSCHGLLQLLKGAVASLVSSMHRERGALTYHRRWFSAPEVMWKSNAVSH